MTRCINEQVLTNLETFTCFLHGLNTIVGKIVSYPKVKKVILNTNKVSTFFNSSHYWGGQELEEAQTRWGIKQRLKTHTETRWYSLIIQNTIFKLHQYVVTDSA